MRAEVIDVAIGGGQVETSVSVDVEQGDSESQEPPRGDVQTDG